MIESDFSTELSKEYTVWLNCLKFKIYANSYRDNSQRDHQASS
jgi:hypothetical protein